MRRYPTNKRGLAISPYELGFTEPSPEFIRSNVTNNHHSYFHSGQYTQEMHSIFRNLVSHLSPLYIPEHNYLHDRYEAPKVPKVSTMVDVLEERLENFGYIEVVLKKCTNQTRIITPEQWACVLKRQQIGYN